jgi:hypothetical protein
MYFDSQVDGEGETVLEHRELPHLDAQRELQAMNAAAAAAIVKAKAEAQARAATPINEVEEEFMDPMEEEVATQEPAAAAQNGHHDTEVEENEAAEDSGSIDLQVRIFCYVGAFSIVNQEEGRVRFDPISGIAEEEEPRANRLHRRDTPHHLKNKRIQSAGSDREQVAQILAQVLVQILHPLFVYSMTSHLYF